MSDAKESQDKEARPDEEGYFVSGGEDSHSSSKSMQSDKNDDTWSGCDSPYDSDNEDLTQFDFTDGTMPLEEHHLQSIEDGNPEVLSLSIGWHEVAEYDWERLGNAIGDNANLWKLRMCKMNAPLCRGMARNRHLRRLEIADIDIALTDGEFFAELAPLFQYNHCLRSLMIRTPSCFHNGYLDNSVEEAEHIRNNVQTLASALSKSDKYSLNEVDLAGNYLHDDHAAKIIGALGPSFNLLTLKLESNKIGMKGCMALASLLENPRSKLRAVFLGGNDIGDECMDVLAKAFKKNKTVKSISLGRTSLSRMSGSKTNPITTIGWRSFAEVLSTPSNSLEDIYLMDTNMDDESANFFAMSAAGLTTLRLLDLRHCDSIGSAGWHCISNFLKNLGTLSVLHLTGNSLDDTTAVELANALVKNKNLQSLDMGSSESITSDGWQAFFCVYPSSESSLEFLEVANNNIDDTAFATLAHTLAGTNLESLGIVGNDWISNDGLRGLLNLLRHPDCKLTSLFLDNNINEDVLIQFANALVQNVTLRQLDIGIVNDVDYSRVCSAYSNLLCNKSSIDATYGSNHSLEDLWGLLDKADREERNRVHHYLDMHKRLQRNGCSKSKVARVKVLDTHFFTEHVNIHVFSEMKRNILPQALHWIGADQDGMSLLYQVLHCMPLLFEFELETRPNLSGAKRKMESKGGTEQSKA